ncbi:hypothetical protein B0A48_00923 [Cryoendolithus antarcticus]|uniref:DEP domain-containing protein n=1 Tax=Cryoendolithus antarcticus TaxID=1507870 RepID=A0A1V8TRQ8_9PEZI|nr:hypothetical protein B0A48_00923 [Cryoendolithus antarcticus]
MKSSPSGKFNSTVYDISEVLAQMQEPPPRGIALQDRRWLSRLYLQCFYGEELTSWLPTAFDDLTDREDAITLASALMQRGAIVHVEGWHLFRDGRYLYQVTELYRTSRADVATTAVSEEANDVEHPDTDDSLKVRSSIEDLDDLAERQEKDAVAAIIVSQIVRLRKKIQGPMSAATLDDLRHLSRLYMMQSDWTAAEALWQEVVGDAVSQLGPDDQRTLDRENELSIVLIQTGKHDEAAEWLERLLSAYSRVRGQYHTETIRVMDLLAGAYKDAGRFEEATALFEKALHTRQQTLPEHHSEIVKAMYRLTCCYNGLERYADSAHMLEQEIALRKKYVNTKDVSTIRARKELGKMYRLLGRLEDSTLLLSSVLEQCYAVLGTTDPLTVEVKSELAATMEAQGDIDVYDAMLDPMYSASAKGDKDTASSLQRRSDAEFAKSSDVLASPPSGSEVAPGSRSHTPIIKHAAEDNQAAAAIGSDEGVAERDSDAVPDFEPATSDTTVLRTLDST